ncbi:MAG: hypothetical protein MJ129_03545 [Clostridia bacterium]|nr:hypothetical protein [Clostridia bacterium]
MKVKRRLVSVLAAIAIICTCVLNIFVSADVTYFGSSGSGNNPFNPRGFFVQTNDGGLYWLSSKFRTPSASSGVADAFGNQVQYTGSDSGLDYVDATNVSGLFAGADRNPTPGYQYLVGYSKNSSGAALTRISNFSSLVALPSRNSQRDPNNDIGWTMKINLNLEPGTAYEFAFLRGMRANNGITCVIAPDNTGYLRTPFTAEEQAYYDSHAYDEYQFLRSATPNEDGSMSLSFVPMRYKVQTYADVSAWNTTRDEVQNFLNSVSEADLASGKYVRENVEYLANLLQQYNSQVEGTIKMELQVEADNDINGLIASISEVYENARQQHQTGPSDLTRFNELMQEARDLYAKASSNIGTDVGQYGADAVANLGGVIDNSEDISISSPQGEVDAACDALEQAIMMVKVSKVSADELRFYDSVTGIFVTVPRGSVPDDVTLYVAQITPEESLYTDVYDLMEIKPDQMTIYQILFMQGMEVVPLNGTASIQIPIFDNMAPEHTAINYINDSKESTYLASAIASGMHVFRTDTMGYFSIVESAEIEMSLDTGLGETTDIINRTNFAPNFQQFLNGMQLEDVPDEQFIDYEPQDAPLKETLPDPNINLDGINKKIDEKDVIISGLALAGVGVLAGLAEYSKSRKKEESII